MRPLERKRGVAREVRMFCYVFWDERKLSEKCGEILFFRLNGWEYFRREGKGGD